MKLKKPSLITIILAVTIIIYIAATLLFCYKTKPEVTSGEFPFTITYEYKGETKTLSGVLKCEFSGSNTIHGQHQRFWHQEVIYDNPENLEYPFVVDQNEELQTTLSIHENMDAGYFMGDPLHKEHYQQQGRNGVEPAISYYDYKNDIFLEDATPEDLASIDFKIVDVTYPEPIENSFSFAGIQYKADNVILFVGIMLVFFLLCLIFVRKDKEYRYTKLDKAGIFFNFLVGILAIPFITFICMLFGIVESDIAIIDQIIYNIPSFVVLCLTLSVVLRRKGHAKAGFLIQFVGIAPFVLIFILEAIFRFH